MYSLLLIIIYIAFISLGLPDSLLGAAWPVMYQYFDVPLSYAGILTMIMCGGTIVSSLLSNRLTNKFGTGLVTLTSVAMTAVALFGFSASDSFIALCLWSIPYGLGAGAVDAALNNYVAIHYASRHMSWLHCFWGVGATVSPYIMSLCLMNGMGWTGGFGSVSIVQILLTVVLFISLPLWKKSKALDEKTNTPSSSKSLLQILKIKGVKTVLITFFSYCALESTTGLWATTYLVQYRGISEETAAAFGSMFYLGITFGRLLCGFILDKLGDRRLIRFGTALIFISIILLGLPIDSYILTLAGLVGVGLGCAPIYPSIIHSTPFNFGKENSQAIIGIQMASAYIGTTFIPPLFGILVRYLNVGIYPLFLLFFAFLMFIMFEYLQQLLIKKE